MQSWDWCLHRSLTALSTALCVDQHTYAKSCTAQSWQPCRYSVVACLPAENLISGISSQHIVPAEHEKTLCMHSFPSSAGCSWAQPGS